MPSKVKFTWTGGRALQQVNSAATRGMRKAGTVVIKEMRRLMLEEPKSGHLYGTHRASAPGEPPASETGRLVRSFKPEINKQGDKIILTISSSEPHFRFTEGGTSKMAKRPLIEPAVKNVTPRMVAIIALEIHKTIGGPKIIS